LRRRLVVLRRRLVLLRRRLVVLGKRLVVLRVTTVGHKERLVEDKKRLLHDKEQLLEDKKRSLEDNHGANHPKVSEFTDRGLPFITAAQVARFSIDYDGAYNRRTTRDPRTASGTPCHRRQDRASSSGGCGPS
jgi:hypothetical protein